MKVASLSRNMQCPIEERKNSEQRFTYKAQKLQSQIFTLQHYNGNNLTLDIFSKRFYNRQLVIAEIRRELQREN
jgi:hypothetical protein